MSRALRLARGVVVVTLLFATFSGWRAQAGQSPAPGVPHPREILGFEPGEDYKLADYRQMEEYFRKLDEASDRVRVFVAGKSTEGNDIIVAAISSEANLASLDRYKTIARRLAYVRDLSDEEARALAREGKAIVWIDNGLHASEVAPAQHAFVLAHKLATEESDEAREIRDNVILVLVPCINPDGLNMVAEWYRKTLSTPHQNSPMPWLYQKYVGHDNNRDAYMQTQIETQVTNRLLYFEWLPQIMYNQHQGTYPPRIFVPPFPDPFNPNIDPQVMRGIELVGGAMQSRFEREAKDGVISRYQFSTWYNGSIRTTAYFHNMIGILTETGHASATPRTYDPGDFPRELRNGWPTLEPTTNYPNPWRGGTLRLRDAMDYVLTGSMGVLEAAAKYRQPLLYGIYQIGARQIRKGASEPPVAYVIPPAQHDPPVAAKFVETLMRGAVEVHRAEAPLVADGKPYPAGTFVVLMAQPFRPFAKDLLEPQRYPDMRAYPGGPPIPPYDTAGWTLAYQMGVKAVAVEKPFEAKLHLLPEGRYPRAAGSVANQPAKASYGFAIDAKTTSALAVVNQLLRRLFTVQRATTAIDLGRGITLPPGAFVVTKGRALDATLLPLVRDLGVTAYALNAAPTASLMPLKPLRVGLYKSWVANMDEGWTRWLFEQHAVPFTTMADKDVRAGRLRARFEVIVLPDQSPADIIQGHRPDAARRGPFTANTPPPEYQGGIGEEGVAALKEFVTSGGTLVMLDEASDLAIERLGIPVRNVTASLKQTDFYCPGSVLRLAVDPTHPVGFGMEPEAAAYFENSRAFEPLGESVKVVARYAARDILMSGWILGESHIAGKPALVEVPVGSGRAILFAFRPQFRGQPHGTFKLLFNALYYGSSLTIPPPPSSPAR